ncbi:MAG TPA: carboxypeptidase M32 [Pirellulales bacterium]|nr:carboxypeptidase M32 [Pirellulales bacterium]
MSQPQKTYDQLVRFVHETAVLQSIEALLGWDERCLLPPAAADYRAEQMTLLTGMIHQRQTDRRLGEWLAELADSPLAKDPASESGATLRQLKRQYDKKTKLPQSLVEELARTSVHGQQVWQAARHDNDFASFAPLLKKTVELKRAQAEAIGYRESLYDALLDDYEPDERTHHLTRVLGALRDELVPLVVEIREARRLPNLEILHRHFPATGQEAFSREVASKIGFDFSRGRLDVTAHPFCTAPGPHDCRITTRYEERNFSCAFFGTLHEAGHGIYDQGLSPDRFGLPPGEAVSMGIHESQSRLWENLVGRHRSFWRHFYPMAQGTFTALADVPLDEFYFAINAVRPSLIRIEADEATYNLHILIRFELEQDLLSGTLAVDDLPGAWNEKYRSYLGVEPPNDAEGVLQDIHWSAGLFGYFPTYSLGNLYAAQFFEQADRDLGGLADQFAAGKFGPLREWLADKIHRHGQRYTARQLVERITGRPLSHEPLLAHLRGKLAPLYGLAK